MGYKALYRTYRPEVFDDVAGQQHIIRTLQHAVGNNKIAHAYLFCGPRGTGKTTIAKIFAKMINCSSDIKPCNTCDNCIAANKGNHSDIIEIDAASNNGVDEVRSLIEKVKYAPIQGQYKVYIIDEVHMMSIGAFNALLKTIEEPPAHVIFILATTDPNKVIPTIISRCQRYDFTKVSIADMKKRIETILQAEQIKCEKGVVELIAQLADGGLRDALSILDQCVAYATDNISLKQLNDIYGITTLQDKIKLILYIDEFNTAALLENVSVLLADGIDVSRLTIDLVNMIKERIIYEYTKDMTLLKVFDEATINCSIINFTTKQCFDMIETLMQTIDKYKNANDAGSYLEVCLLKMMEVRHPNKELSEAVDVVTPSSIDKSMDEDKQVTDVTSDDNPVITEEESKQEAVTERINEKSIESLNVDVSRETFKPTTPDEFTSEMIENTQEIILKAEEVSSVLEESKDEIVENNILRLLSGASKPEREKDLANFNKVTQYCLDFEWASIANTLKDATLFASGNNYCVVSVVSGLIANDINKKNMNDNYLRFTKLLFGKPKKVFAVSNEQHKQIISLFKDKMIEGSLPEPLRVEEIIIREEVKEEVTNEDVIIDVFGKENILIKEE